MNDWELNRELSEFKRQNMIHEKELSNKRNEMSNLLLNEMGRDMDDVLNGKIKIKLSFFEKIKYKLINIFNRLFNIL